ncbi:MAG: hypothetical protein U5J96_13950 [Ignavibacteriaceae bacterium]|nr:hypothetical protein [Ignavibacteriaceae bacterium]
MGKIGGREEWIQRIMIRRIVSKIKGTRRIKRRLWNGYIPGLFMGANEEEDSGRGRKTGQLGAVKFRMDIYRSCK